MRRQGMGRNQLGEEVGAGGGGAGRPTGAGLPVRLLWLLRLAGLLRPGLARLGAAVRAELHGVANAARADARRERARRRGPSNGSPRPASSNSHCTFFPALSYRPKETSLGSGPRPRDRRVSAPRRSSRGVIAVSGRGGDHPEERPPGTFSNRAAPPDPRPPSSPSSPPPDLEEHQGRRPKSPAARHAPRGEAGCLSQCVPQSFGRRTGSACTCRPCGSPEISQSSTRRRESCEWSASSLPS